MDSCSREYYVGQYVTERAAAEYSLGAGTTGKKANGKADTLLVNTDKQDPENSYKLPLVWIDLEMTGKHVVSWRVFLLVFTFYI